jgi:acetyl esterase/lipase
MLFFTLALCLIATQSALASIGRAKDTLVLGNKTFEISQLPMSAYWHVDEGPANGRVPLPKFEFTGSGNWRGYIAQWSISRGKLRLLSVEGQIAGKKVRNTQIIETRFPIHARWYTGKIFVPVGDFDDSQKAFEHVLEFSIKDGNVVANSYHEFLSFPTTWNGLPDSPRPGQTGTEQDALARWSVPAVHLPPVPAHLSEEAKSVLRSAPEDVRKESILNAADSYQKVVPEFKTIPVTLGGVKAYWASTPKTQRDDAVVVYVHGGGYLDDVGREDAGTLLPVFEQLGVKGLSVDYRVGEANPFGITFEGDVHAGIDGCVAAAVEDCVSLYLGLLEEGYQPQNIAFTGRSTGGAIVLATVIRLREDGHPLPAAMALISPGPVDRTYSGDTRNTLLEWDTWLSGKTPNQHVRGNPRNPLVSPIFADLHGLPPMLIQVGTREWLLSDSVRLARKARESNVDVTLDVWDGMWNSFHMMWTQVPESREACTAMADFLRPRILGQNKGE